MPKPSHNVFPVYAQCLALSASIMACADAAEQASIDVAPAVVVETLMTRNLESRSDQEVVMLTVRYPAAGASLPHRHDAQVFVYVLEGHVTMQVRGAVPVTLKPGDSFYEGPDDVHIMSANASKTNSAKMLVVMIKDRGKPASRAAD